MFHNTDSKRGSTVLVMVSWYSSFLWESNQLLDGGSITPLLSGSLNVLCTEDSEAAAVILNEAIPPTGNDGLIVGFSLKGNLHPGA